MLYVCATPIGNLGDVTPRVLEALREAELVAAEDTRRTRKLLSHFDIHTHLTSFFQHNELQKTDEVLRLLRDGSTVALVTDAGMPGVQDPGMLLVQKVVSEGLDMTVLPGAVRRAHGARGGRDRRGGLPLRRLPAAARPRAGVVARGVAARAAACSSPSTPASGWRGASPCWRRTCRTPAPPSAASSPRCTRRSCAARCGSSASAIPCPAPTPVPRAAVRGEITLVIDLGRPHRRGDRAARRGRGRQRAAGARPLAPRRGRGAPRVPRHAAPRGGAAGARGGGARRLTPARLLDSGRGPLRPHRRAPAAAGRRPGPRAHGARVRRRRVPGGVERLAPGRGGGHPPQLLRRRLGHREHEHLRRARRCASRRTGSRRAPWSSTRPARASPSASATASSPGAGWPATSVPAAQMVKPMGNAEPDALRATFAEQARALVGRRGRPAQHRDHVRPHRGDDRGRGGRRRRRRPAGAGQHDLQAGRQGLPHHDGREPRGRRRGAQGRRRRPRRLQLRDHRRADGRAGARSWPSSAAA